MKKRNPDAIRVAVINRLNSTNPRTNESCFHNKSVGRMLFENDDIQSGCGLASPVYSSSLSIPSFSHRQDRS